jgi:hypothetical protein
VPRKRVPNALYRAFDDAQFGDARTLNLRDGLPSGTEAAARAEAWLRLKQVDGTREVLIITGRGTHSVGSIPVIRTLVAQRLARLRRVGVVESVREHTPGSYVVRLSAVGTMPPPPERSPRQSQAVPHAPSLVGLTSQTRRLVQELALRTLESLGLRKATRTIVHDEMQRQISLLTAAMPRDANREDWVRSAAQRALNDME